MKKRITRYLYILASVVLMISCAPDQTDYIGPDTAGEVQVSVTVSAPATRLPSSPATRAVNESAIDKVDILVFEKEGGDFEYKYRVKGFSISQTGNGLYRFDARISTSSNPLRLYMLANAPALEYLVPGSDERQVREIVASSFTSAGADLSLPMSGIVELPTGVSVSTQVSGVMVRSMARVDITNSASNFTMRSVRIYRANDKVQIIPNSMTDDKVNSASVSPGSQQNVNTTPLTVTGASIRSQIYVPESAVPAETDRRLKATCVVVGGVFLGDDKETFYRMDFEPDSNPDLFGQILRNHRYDFNITAVLGSGWFDPDEAAVSSTSNLTVEIKEWQDETASMVFDGTNHFGVSSRVARFNYRPGKTYTIDVDTDLPSYTMYWTDDSGGINQSFPPIEPGGSGVSPNGKFAVSLSPDGTLITVTTNEINETGTPFTSKAMIQAGRLEIGLTMIQEHKVKINKHVYVYGSLYELGRLGDELFGYPENADRPEALVKKLKYAPNFGPGGKVDFEGFLFGGKKSYEMSMDVIGMFDVVYLTYAGNPSAASVSTVSEWLEADQNRVLFVQYDNTTTNARMLAHYGLQCVLCTKTTPSTIYTGEIPEVIMNGPFGTVDKGMLYRAYDTTHGGIKVDQALAQGVSPILINADGNMALGIDFKRRIVYCGDIDLNYGAVAHTGQYLNNNTSIGNDAEKLMANIWAWIADVVLTQE